MCKAEYKNGRVQSVMKLKMKRKKQKHSSGSGRSGLNMARPASQPETVRLWLLQDMT
jgi:hypothetical protein